MKAKLEKLCENCGLPLPNLLRYHEAFKCRELLKERNIALEGQLAEAQQPNQRFFDLVRQQRMELHEAELISDEEYTELAKEHSAVARLEDYDAIRLQRDQAREQIVRMANDLRESEEASAKLTREAREECDRLRKEMDLLAEANNKIGGQVLVHADALNETSERVEQLVKLLLFLRGHLQDRPGLRIKIDAALAPPSKEAHE